MLHPSSLHHHQHVKTQSCCRGRRPTRRQVTSPGVRRPHISLWAIKTVCLSAEGEDSETPPLCGETIHYASLGRQNWRERPSRSPPEQSHHSVIYSVISRPAARAEHELWESECSLVSPATQAVKMLSVSFHVSLSASAQLVNGVSTCYSEDSFTGVHMCSLTSGSL